MRLLQISSDGDLSLVEYFGSDIPPYAILSHTWGADDDEISYKDVKKNRARSKPSGYHKVRFCGEQALRDDIYFFWVDTCCIKQDSDREVSEAINSMYRWYHNAVTCYVYLSDVMVDGSTSPLAVQFRSSRWFTRGWTLQELLAPVSVQFFSWDGHLLGNRTSLLPAIQSVTGIAEAALCGSPLSSFSIDERISWARTRTTKREEDAAYSLLGIFDIHMPLIYGEGRKNALKRLQREIATASRDDPLSPLLSLPPAGVSNTSSTNLSARGTSAAAASSHDSCARAGVAHFVFRVDEVRYVPESLVQDSITSIRVNEGITGKWWYCNSDIYQISEPISDWKPYQVCTIYYDEGVGFTIGQGDGTSESMRGKWKALNFEHDDKDFSSFLSNVGTHLTLRCQRSDALWPSLLLPDIYHGPRTPHRSYGGLKGSLSIFLALMAFSVEVDELQRALRRIRAFGRWQCWFQEHGRVNGRGVVVYVYSGTEPGSTPEDLKAYEDGIYGNYFD